jgi:hypothetical protein
MYQGKLCSARPRRAAGPRPDLADQPTATKPRPKWKRPARRPARHAVLKSAMTKINYKKWETATSWDCHPASADPFRRGPPRSSVQQKRYRSIGLTLSGWPPESTGLALPISTGAGRADGHAGCVVHSSLALIAASWIRAAANAATMALLTAASWAGCIRAPRTVSGPTLPRAAGHAIATEVASPKGGGCQSREEAGHQRQSGVRRQQR